MKCVGRHIRKRRGLAVRSGIRFGMRLPPPSGGVGSGPVSGAAPVDARSTSRKGGCPKTPVRTRARAAGTSQPPAHPARPPGARGARRRRAAPPPAPAAGVGEAATAGVSTGPRPDVPSADLPYVVHLTYRNRPPTVA
ncbi:hypothetical protein GCM10010505_19830 [Kitasatospora aburaviensis]